MLTAAFVYQQRNGHREPDGTKKQRPSAHPHELPSTIYGIFYHAFPHDSRALQECEEFVIIRNVPDKLRRYDMMKRNFFGKKGPVRRICSVYFLETHVHTAGASGRRKESGIMNSCWKSYAQKNTSPSARHICRRKKGKAIFWGEPFFVTKEWFPQSPSKKVTRDFY